MNHCTRTLTALALLLSHGGAEAQTPIRPDPLLWGLCAADPLAGAVTADTGASSEAPVNFTAESVRSSATEATLRGDVRVSRGDQRLRASRVTLDRVANRLTAEGGVVYGDPTLALRSDRAEWDLTGQVGIFNATQYFLPERNAQGSAEQVRTDRRSRESRLRDVTYSTCERGNEFWQLRSGRLDVNENSGRGWGRNVTLAIKGVPVLYFPYLSFPINNQRQSGFLTPGLGYDSTSGFDARVPYYWNIAPDRDLTIAPRAFTRRGFMLGTEYRFLNPSDNGVIDLEYLPEDRVRGSARGSIHIDHRSNPAPKLYTNLLYQYVSDADYLNDFGNNLDLLTPSYLERHLESVYYGEQWSAQLRLQGFQTIDKEVFAIGSDRPYNRLPQVLFDGAWPQQAYGLTYALRSEAVYFDHPSEVTGTRLDILPQASLPLEWPQGYLTPRVSYRYTAYALQDTAAFRSMVPMATDTPTRGAPIISMDSGLFFERPLGWFGHSAIQTLEPRLFYLYVPFRDQNDIPVFDSTEVDRSFAWLFLDNRFTGADRLGDANQLTTALTTRLIGAGDGREWLTASIGQVQYFENRRVALDSTQPVQNNTASNSDLIAEALANLTAGLGLRGIVHWDPDGNEARRRAVDLRYHPGGGRLLNFAYRFSRDDEIEQVDVSMLWPLNPRWTGVGRWNYSLQDARTIDAFAGFEYGECCWALRMLARSHRDQPSDTNARASVLVQLELKGLSSVGSRVDRLLEDSIFGFERTRY